MVDLIFESMLAGLIGYSLGSFPTGYLVGRARGVDIRQHGSGRTGGANVMRTLGFLAAILTAMGDVGKGTLAVLIARGLFGDEAAAAIAGVGVTLGHNWPVTLRFQGGAGVGTTFGALLAFAPAIFLGLGALFLLVTLATRYASLGSLTFSLLLPIAMLGWVWLGQEPSEHLAWALVASGVIVVAHRPNIQRLLAGQERRLGEPAERRGASS